MDAKITTATNGQRGTSSIVLEGDKKISQGGVAAKPVSLPKPTFSDPSKNIRELGFKSTDEVADFGSGSGVYTLALSKMVKKVYAVDVQKDLLTRIENHAEESGLDNVEIVWGNIEEARGIGLRDETLDGVLLSNTLFQVGDKIGTIKEAWRVLKPGGVLAVIDWTDSYGGLGPRASNILTQSEANLICTDNNFAFKGDFDAGEHHYGILYIKMRRDERIEETMAEVKEKEEEFISKTVEQEVI